MQSAVLGTSVIHILRAAAISTVVAVLSMGESSPMAAQGLVVPEGSRVRLTWTSLEQAAPDWLIGRVMESTSGNRLSMIPDGREQPTTVLMDQSTRLQIYRGRVSRLGLGAGIGAAVGAAVGGLFLSDGFGGINQRRGAFEWTQGMLVFGTVGAGAGAVVALLRGNDRWEEIPLQDGRIPIPPLTSETSDTVPLRSVQRWERFSATEFDFSAFFRQHADSLDPVEGIWEAVGEQHFAIVRDGRYADFHYVAVRLYSDEVSTRTQVQGIVFAAIQKNDDPALLGVQFVGQAMDFRGRTLPAFQSGPALIVRMLDRPVERWVKVYP